MIALKVFVLHTLVEVSPYQAFGWGRRGTPYSYTGQRTIYNMWRSEIWTY